MPGKEEYHHQEVSLPDVLGVAETFEDQPYTLSNGMLVYTHSPLQTRIIEDEIFRARAYDGSEYGITYPSEEGVIVDVGTQNGLFTLFAHEQSPTARLIAIEPVSLNRSVLEKTFAHHALPVTLLAYGLADTQKTAEITVFPYMSGMSGFHPETQKEEPLLEGMQTAYGDAYTATELRAVLTTHYTEAVQLVTVSDVLSQQGIEAVAILKIDAEGSEAEILSGIQEEDWVKLQQFLIETHDKKQLDFCENLLVQHGYIVTVEFEQADREKAKKQGKEHDGLAMIYATRENPLGRNIPSTYVSKKRHQW